MSKFKSIDSITAPTIPASKNLPEITWRVLIIGTFLTIILAAANAYLGLKVGQTISASIPAAIISMSILRFCRNSNVLENTMVQTMASVGEALTAGVAFILPALIILHAWNGFYYWQTVIIALLGGMLGVLFTIPLRKVLLIDKTLRYPEGLAISNILKASINKEETDIKALTFGGIVGGVISLAQTGLQVLADSFQFWVQTSQTVFGFGLGLSPALIAAGYIVGINVAISLIVGILIGWIAGVPILTWVYGIPHASNANEIASLMWHDHIRYLGVGTMLVGGLWTLVTLVKPIVYSLSTSFNSMRQAKLTGEIIQIRTERDIPINYVFWSIISLLIAIFLLILTYIMPEANQLSHTFKTLIAAFCALYVLVGGFTFCSISAYFAGLIGSTNNPVSGLLVSSLLILCLILLCFFGFSHGIKGNEVFAAVVAIGSTVIIAAALAISNDTMQDLKVGQLLGATPWKQQVMLIAGVVVSAFVIPPILDLLYNAYGIGGVFPRADMPKGQMLAAPQAGLMATVAEGVFADTLEWSMIIVGAVIAVICIIIDEILKNYDTRLPVLAVGVGIYLPLDASVPVVIGGLLAHFIQSRLNKRYGTQKRGKDASIATHKHRGLLLACGIVAGASIMGVVLAIPFALYQSSDALRIMPDQYQYLSGPLGIIVTVILCAWMYKVVMKKNA
ncbi:MAG: oligopeptide transporter, OPT family [Gammaproteobacteria bacterium]|nr:oligopeptide transporter, OPT family [Gammaproteobacteria bacterium]